MFKTENRWEEKAMANGVNIVQFKYSRGEMWQSQKCRNISLDYSRMFGRQDFFFLLLLLIVKTVNWFDYDYCFYLLIQLVDDGR